MKKSRLDSLVRLTLDRPITVLMLLLSTVLVGIVAQRNIELELLPSGLTSSEVSVTIPVPNANPVEVEEQVTRPTEEVLRQISGLDEITTSSSKDRSSINIKFARGRNPDEAFAEVRDLMEVAKLSWPEDVQEYFTFRFNLDTDLPVMQFGLLLDEWESDTSFVIDEKIIKEIESVDGVARVEAWGIVEEAVRIYVDKERSWSHGVAIFDIAQKLSADNRDFVGGRVVDSGRYFYLRSAGRFRSLDDVEKFPLRPGLTLGDVAEVTTAQSYRNFVFRVNGKRAVWFNINKEATANTVDVCAGVRAKLDDHITKDRRLIERGWTWFRPEMRDFGNVVESTLTDLVRTAFIGGLIAILPLFLFLRQLRMTLIIGLAIPASLVITLGCLYFTGGSMNLLSMAGITIAIGMLVDNSIVVVENVRRRREEGLSARAAALHGTSEVALAITLATLTTVVAFLPLIFMDAGAEAAYFAKAIGLPVCYAVLASLFVAVFFIPLGTVLLYGGARKSSSITARVGAALGRAASPGALLLLPLVPLDLLAALFHRFVHLLENFHAWVLEWSLFNRFLALVLIVLGSVGLTAALRDDIKLTEFTDASGGFVMIDVDLESNFTLGDANGLFIDMHAKLEERWDDLGVALSYYWFSKNGGTIILGLADSSPDVAKRAVVELKASMPRYPGAKITVGVQRQDPDKSSTTLRVFGQDIEVLDRIAEDLSDRLELVPGVTKVSGGIQRSDEELVVAPDRQRMQLYGISPRTLMGTVQYSIRGQRLPDFQAGDQKMMMFVEMDEADATTAEDVANMAVWDGGTGLQPLSNLANIYYRKGYGTIRKTNGRASLTLTVESLEGKTEGIKDAIAEVQRGYPLPQGYEWSPVSSDDFDAQLRELRNVGILALVLILLLMGILFESVLLPFAVFKTIPFAVLGSIWGLALTNTSLDMVGMIGAFVLFGIVVNNGIVFLDAAHRLVTDGVPRTEALVTAGRRRLRPILMTTATTVVGLFPMAIADASASPISYKVLARVVMSGLIVSTAATLIVVPIFYSLYDDLRRIWRDIWGAIRHGEAPEPEPPPDPPTAEDVTAIFD